MTALILSNRHAVDEWCDCCGHGRRRVAKIYVPQPAPQPPTEIRICRPCALELARATRLRGHR